MTEQLNSNRGGSWKRDCGRGTRKENQVRHDVFLRFSTLQGETASPVGLVMVESAGLSLRVFDFVGRRGMQVLCF